MPLTGQRLKITVRQLAKPVSWPSHSGEFAAMAVRVGSQGRIRFRTCTPASRSGTATWTWVPLTSCSATSCGACVTIARYRAWSVTATGRP